MVLRHSDRQQQITHWLLTILAAVAVLQALFFPLEVRAELRAFRLKIQDSQAGTERLVTTRFDHIQYPMYHHVRRSEVVMIEKTWMCYRRSDFAGELCPPPAESPATNGAVTP